MTRRDLLKMPAAGLGSASNAARPPNLVFILADDAGYGDFGCYGQTRIRTPHIDRLAAEGMRFTQHYAGGAVCAPSRCTLMTGLHTGHAPIRGNQEIPGFGPVALPEDMLTVPRLLKRAGYATGMTGRWHLGELSSRSQPHQMGFDYFIGALAGTAGPDPDAYYRARLREGDRDHPLAGNGNGRRALFDQEVLTAKAEEFIRRHRKTPFFLYAPYSLVHAPYMAPDLGAYRDRDWPEVEKTYAAMVTLLDSYVGRIAALLEKLGIMRDTLLLFASDNGPESYPASGHRIEFFDSNGPLRGGKRDLYEGGIRIPFIARWPGRIRAGSTSAHPSAFWDFLPTAAELAGVTPPPGLDGISYLPELLGRPRKPHSRLYWESHERRKLQAVRQDRWKLIRFASEDRCELYDLNEDPREERDLSARMPGRVAALRSLMARSRVPSPQFPLPGEEGRT